MSLLGRIWSAIRGRTETPGGAPAAKRKRVRGTYDNALPGGENAEHWASADGLSANAANDPSTRKVLRERARYECDNNGYLGGLVEKVGNALVGACPRPQVRLPATYTDPDFGVEQQTKPDAAAAVETAFNDWAKAVMLGQKLRLLDNAATRDGEGFGLFVTNPLLPPTGVQLDLRLYETDQVDTPWFSAHDALAFPGGRIDEAGNVTEWHFLKAHPGSSVWFSGMYDFDPIPSSRVVHWFKPKRAGQLRGVPEVLSSLGLCAILRRYTLAVLGAAEFAASISGVLETEDVTPPTAAENQTNTTDSTFDRDMSVGSSVSIPRRHLLTLPGGWKAKAFEGTQPTTTFKEFKGEILAEAGQPVLAPRNVSTGSSAEYNYSSGRLDLGIFQDAIKVRRHDFTGAVLSRVFAAWLAEARLIPGYLPEGLPPVESWAVEWRFPGFVSLDPKKDADTDAIRLGNNTTTLAEIYAEKGEDWEEALRQRAREVALLKELGLDAVAPPPPGSTLPAPETEPIEARARRLRAGDPDQPRDDEGQWSESGGGGGGGSGGDTARDERRLDEDYDRRASRDRADESRRAERAAEIDRVTDELFRRHQAEDDERDARRFDEDEARRGRRKASGHARRVAVTN